MTDILCVYCGKKLPPRKKKYCDNYCKERFLREGPAVERWKYEENPNPSKAEIESLLSNGAWMMYPASMDNEQVIGEFIRVWHHPPQEVLWTPSRPINKFAGPVWDEEELARRWQGWQEAVIDESKKDCERTAERVKVRQDNLLRGLREEDYG